MNVSNKYWKFHWSAEHTTVGWDKVMSRIQTLRQLISTGGQGDTLTLMKQQCLKEKLQKVWNAIKISAADLC